MFTHFQTFSVTPHLIIFISTLSIQQDPDHLHTTQSTPHIHLCKPPNVKFQYTGFIYLFLLTSCTCYFIGPFCQHPFFLSDQFFCCLVAFWPLFPVLYILFPPLEAFFSFLSLFSSFFPLFPLAFYKLSLPVKSTDKHTS